MSKCKVDLTKSDEYPDLTIPDEDIEICLKVIRTLRNYALYPETFDANISVTLSHAHAQIVGLVELAIDGEEHITPISHNVEAKGKRLI